MDTLLSLARTLGAMLVGEDAGFTRVVTDSRQLQDHDLFVALKGETFDGHDFVARAQAAGAAGALVARRIDCPLPQVVVPDTLAALQQYGASWRMRFDLPVVGVTGSNGKTTTKQILASILAARGPVLATVGNLNNHIGVPLTLLSLRERHRTAVIEMGANHPGEIALLTRLARPGVGVVTQAGDAHLEGFGSREGVARAKGELFAGLAHGVAVINADDVYADLWRRLANGNAILAFGLRSDADVGAVHLQHDVEGSAFDLVTPHGREHVRVPLPGAHNVMNALAASACAIAVGVDLHDIGAGLARVEAAAGRVRWKPTSQGARVLDDSYNANPTSLAAALELMAALPGERWAVLGGMAELGADAPRLHFEAGQRAKALGLQKLFTLGPLAAEAARSFGAGAQAFDDIEALIAALRAQLTAGTAVLVKGSRSSRMERVVAALTGETAAEKH